MPTSQEKDSDYYLRYCTMPQTTKCMKFGYLVLIIQEKKPMICIISTTRQYRGRFGWMLMKSN